MSYNKAKLADQFNGPLDDKVRGFSIDPRTARLWGRLKVFSIDEAMSSDETVIDGNNPRGRRIPFLTRVQGSEYLDAETYKATTRNRVHQNRVQCKIPDQQYLTQLCAQEVDRETLVSIDPKHTQRLISHTRRLISAFHRRNSEEPTQVFTSFQDLLGKPITDGAFFMIYFSSGCYSKDGELTCAYHGFGPKTSNLLEKYLKAKKII